MKNKDIENGENGETSDKKESSLCHKFCFSNPLSLQRNRINLRSMGKLRVKLGFQPNSFIKELSHATNSNILLSISLQPNILGFRYLKLYEL